MSKIEWTEKTWNPIAGCSKVSPGCTNCYAEKMAGRLEAMGQAKYEGLTVLQGSHRVWTGKIAFDEHALLEPLRRKTPTTYFVNSMSDLFHENVTDEQIDRIFAVMALCPQHTFQVLTKRPERMQAYLLGSWRTRLIPWLKMWQKRPAGYGVMLETTNGVLANVWLGVSVENQKAADERIPLLLQTPATVRFISAEPLLGPVDLENLPSHSGIGRHLDALSSAGCEEADISTKLDWVIVGGESGPGARPMHPDWARSLRDQCESAGVAFFFKQWGEWTPGENVDQVAGVVATALWFDNRWLIDRESLSNNEGHVDDQPDLYRVGKKAAGALLDGREWKQLPGGAR